MTDDKPIEVNLNVKVEHEINIKVDKQIDSLMDNKNILEVFIEFLPLF